jgi:hypothetical protein
MGSDSTCDLRFAAARAVDLERASPGAQGGRAFVARSLMGILDAARETVAIRSV